MDPTSSQEGKNIDLKSFASAVAQIAEEKGVSPEKVLESIEAAIAAAYKKGLRRKGASY